MSFLYNLVGRVTISPCSTAQADVQLQDVDGDGSLTVNDGVHLLRYLYVGGPPPFGGAGCVSMPDCPSACP